MEDEQVTTTVDPSLEDKYVNLSLLSTIEGTMLCFAVFFARISSKNAPRHSEPFDQFRSVV